MAGGSVRTVGLEELILELTHAPDEIRRDAMEILREEVEDAAAEIRQAYPVGETGNLRKGVKTDFPSSTLLIGRVISAAKHSHLYEFGTMTRQTASGASRGRVEPLGAGGRPQPVTVPIARRHRRKMFERMKDLLIKKGFKVSGG